MPYDPSKHHRRSIRLQGYDYRQAGGYFITICTFRRAHVFGEIIGGVMRLNLFGDIALEEWKRTGIIRPNAEVDEFVVMPNHLHGIIMLSDDGTLQNNIGENSVGANCDSPLNNET